MSFVMYENLSPRNAKSVKDATRALYRLLVGLRVEARKQGVDEMEVRLVSDKVGVLWVNTGDVSYDTHHGDYCAAGSFLPDDDNDQLHLVAVYLVNEVVDQFADEADSTIDPDAYCKDHGTARATCDESH